ncbi:MAG TPA: cation:proton antiporter [Mycobacteriales bacterium]
MLTAAVVGAVLVLGYAATAAALGRLNVSAPLAFVVAGSVLGFAGDPRSAQDVVWIRAVADGTLALILFHDATRASPRELRAASGLVLRLLLVGWPLAVLAHFLTARVAFPDQPVMLSLFVAAALAPTDAGLGAPTLLNPAVPVRIRAVLNAESGFNDGLATPVALFAIAALAGSGSGRPAASTMDALGELAVGCASGAVVGVAGAVVLGWSRRHGASTPSGRSLGLLSLPILSFGGAEMLHGNGFVAAFVAGLAFAAAAGWLRKEESVLRLTEGAGELLGSGTWLVFGLVAVPQLWRAVGWREVFFALLSLTVLRMVPVALSLARSGLQPATVAYLGWSGPRGLATVVFTLLAVESLQLDGVTRRALLAVALTVLLSVVAHGVTAEPLARRYGRWVQLRRPALETGVAAEPRPRGTLARRGRR